MAKRTLSDLYRVGKDVVLDDGDGSVTIWVQKLNPADHRAAMIKANAARARTLLLKTDKESDDYVAIMNDILEYSHDALIEILCAVEQVRITPIKESEVAFEDKWKDEDYLTGLRTSWDDEMKDRFEEDENDLEAARVKKEIDKFIAEVNKAVDGEMEMFKEGLETLPDYELREKVETYNLGNVADANWINAYYQWEVYYGVRDKANHRERYFSHFSEVTELDGRVFSEISEAFRDLTVEPSEGKDLAVMPPSSDSSVLSEAEAQPASSGPSEQVA